MKVSSKLAALLHELIPTLEGEVLQEVTTLVKNMQKASTLLPQVLASSEENKLHAIIYVCALMLGELPNQTELEQEFPEFPDLEYKEMVKLLKGIVTTFKLRESKGKSTSISPEINPDCSL